MLKALLDANRDCLVRIPRIVEMFYMQRFYSGAKELMALINDLQRLDKLIHNHEYSNLFGIHEYSLILKTLSDAQDKEDYIMIADVLNCELQPCLQDLAINLQQKTGCDGEDYFNENMYLFKEINPEVHDEIMRNPDCLSGKYVCIMALNGQITMKYIAGENEFCMHSILNPQREAEIFARQFEKEGLHEYYVFGMGLGYHIVELLNQSVLNRVTVLEYDIELLRFTMQVIDYTPYLNNGQLEIVYQPIVNRR